jgi:hypothetical protein
MYNRLCIALLYWNTMSVGQTPGYIVWSPISLPLARYFSVAVLRYVSIVTVKYVGRYHIRVQVIGIVVPQLARSSSC